MLWVPMLSVLMLHAALRLLPEPVSAMALQPLSALPPSVKLTLPVGLVPTTVAVKDTLAPLAAGFAELAKLVVVALGPGVAARTAAAASTIPAPHSAVVQSLVVPTGNARAELDSFDATCDGVSEG